MVSLCKLTLLDYKQFLISCGCCIFVLYDKAN